MITGRPLLSVVWVMFPKTETIRSHNSRAGSPSNLNPASKEMISDFCWTVWNWSLFVTHPTYWKQMYDFQKRTMFLQKWILNPQDLPAKSESWNSPNLRCFEVLPTWQYCFVFACMMNVRNQSIQAFVTCFSPFCNGSCELIYWP